MENNNNSKISFDPYIFRDYDIRGLVPEDFNKKKKKKLALALDQFFEEGPIVLSRDLRKSGIPLLQIMQTTLNQKGRKVINIGENPTPLLYYAICKENAAAGIQITASHKPLPWNGFKINKKNAEPIDAATGIYQIKKIVTTQESNASESKIPLAIEYKSYKEEYIKEITNKIKIKRPLTVVVDTGNGSVSSILRIILENLGCKVIAINEVVDDSFPSHPADPHVNQNLKQLQSEVKKHNADICLALDGDGDRCAIVDNCGQIVSKDKSLMLLTKDALEKKKGPIVTEVRASMAYLNFIKESGGTPIIAKAGHSFVLRKVKEHGAVFGGELTGHMFFPLEFYNFDDGIFTVVKFVEILSKLEIGFNLHLKSLPEYLPSPEFVITDTDKTKFQKIKKITELVKSEGKEYLDIDGVRITYPKLGWLLIRASNTGPKIKCRFEAKTMEGYDFLKSELKRFLSIVDLGFY